MPWDIEVLHFYTLLWGEGIISKRQASQSPLHFTQQQRSTATIDKSATREGHGCQCKGSTRIHPFQLCSHTDEVDRRKVFIRQRRN